MSSNPVAYWPPTRPSSQKKKCTCVNNRCIPSKISRDQDMALTVLRLNGVGIKQWYNPGDKKFRAVGNQSFELSVPVRALGTSSQQRAKTPLPDPRLSSPGERERKAVIARRVEGSICCSLCSVSNSLSHKEVFSLVFLVLSLWFCIWVYNTPSLPLLPGPLCYSVVCIYQPFHRDMMGNKIDY